MRRILAPMLLVLLWCIPALCWGQETGALEGLVRIKGSREPVTFAPVRLEDSSFAAETDAEGRFVFAEVPPGNYTLTIGGDFVREHRQAVAIVPGQTARVTIYVRVNVEELDEIVVSEKREPEHAAHHEISREELTGVAGAGNDAVRVVQNLPGVTKMPPFYGGGLVIRGASASDSAYYLNNFDIPILFHFGSLISVVNSELIESINYYPGGFSARYGNALGGIVDITTRRPDCQRFGGVVDLATYSSYVMFEGPLGEDMAAAGAVRRSFVDFFLPLVIPEDQQAFTLSPRFYDYTGLFEYTINDKNLLTATVFGADDAIGLISDEGGMQEAFVGDSFDFSTAFHRGDVRWDFVPDSALQNMLALDFIYNLTNMNLGDEFYVELTGPTVALREELSWRLADWNRLRLGLDGGLASVRLKSNIIRSPKEGDTGAGDLLTSDSYETDLQIDTFMGDVFAEEMIDLGRWATLIPGLRVDYLDYTQLAHVDPRLTMRLYPALRTTIKTNVGVYHQFPSFDEILEDYGNPDLASEVAYNYAGGVEYDFGQGYSLDVQGYYKQLDNLVASTGADSDEPYENTGIGYVYGGELLARKQLSDRFFGWISYTYSVSKRKDRPGEDWRLFDQDQPHNFIVVASYKLGENRDWRIGGRWQYSTGLPYTEIVGRTYNADTDTYLPLYSDETNNERLPDFHQLDVRIDKAWTFNRWTLAAYLDVQNAYFYRYPFGYWYNHDYTEREKVVFPTFFPSLGLQARF